ncbi:lytic transglycosylase [Lysobacteraceae bacterium NML91-0213]|nr:lytic transglycosylase [Xanthomonadaceae bacterium NML91-0213]
MHENLMSIRVVQQKLRDAGFDPGAVDGLWGHRTAAALDAALNAARSSRPDPPMAWGARVSAEFRGKVRAIASRLGTDADDLMACMAWETGRTFSPAVRNRAGSGATGLIQFMPATARGLGTTTDALAKMTALQQLDYVERYFAPYRGRLRNLGDLYMAILWPAGIGKADSYVLWDRPDRPTTYRQNAGIDINRDGRITRGEALAKVSGLLAEGRRPGNLWPGR